MEIQSRVQEVKLLVKYFGDNEAVNESNYSEVAIKILKEEIKGCKKRNIITNQHDTSVNLLERINNLINHYYKHQIIKEKINVLKVLYNVEA